MDLYIREVISYGISHRPTSDLIMHPLKENDQIVKNNATVRTTIHS